MDKFFGQRNPGEGKYKPVNYSEISEQQASLKSGCDVFFQKYIKSILEEGELSAYYMQRKAVRPGDLLKEIIVQHPLLRDNSVGLINLSKDEINVDSNQIKFAFSKVIENAIHYSEGKLIATIQIEKANKAIVISVKDQGIGIDPFEKEKIFQPFFRGLDSAKFSKGIGLGLTLSKEIFKNHNADIRVESAGRGLGTSVFISFPFEEKGLVYRAQAGRPAEQYQTLAY